MQTSHQNYPPSKHRIVMWILLVVILMSSVVYYYIYYIYTNFFSWNKMISYSNLASGKKAGFINTSASSKVMATSATNFEHKFTVVRYKDNNNCYVRYPALEACSSKHGYPPFNISIDKFNDARLYMRLLKLDSLGKCVNSIDHNVSPLPTIVTALSSNHFKEALYLLTSIMHIVMATRTTHLIIYDIGLSELENLQLRAFVNNLKCTTCFVRAFPFEMFPEHVRNIQGYTWKPLIISMVLKEFPYIMWVDTSVRLRLSIFTLFEKGARCHLQLPRLEEWEMRDVISVQTGKKTMAFLRLNESDYKSILMIMGGFGLYQRTKIVMERIIKPWVACALTFGCMVTDEDYRALSCDPPRDGRKFAWCHRFDQSILSILISTVFPNYWKENTFSLKDYATIQRL